MKIIMTLPFVMTMLSTSSFGWSSPGHEAIARASIQMLDNQTRDKVNAILDGESIDDAAIWLDRVREDYSFPEESDAEEAAQFRQTFPRNESWHFCNFIVGSTQYDFSSKYASPDDVVHALENAIAVLEGASSKMTKEQALRSVIHLVGDIHQPLHCITGYFDLSDMSRPVLISNVDDPQTAPQDRGGNQLYYTSSQELHAMWDLTLPKHVASDVATLASDITTASAASAPITPGDYHHWAETWAGESMQQANGAYDGIRFNSAAYVSNPRHPNQQMLKINISFQQGARGYIAAEEGVCKAQLRKAALHLTQLLEKINFQ